MQFVGWQNSLADRTITQHRSFASNPMFVTVYTPPKIVWQRPGASTQPGLPSGLQAQRDLRAPPLVRDQVQNVCNAPVGPQVDSRAARQTQAQANPAPELPVRQSWLHGQWMQRAERTQATFPSVANLAARIDYKLESVRNPGNGSPPRAHMGSNAVAGPSQRPSSPPQYGPAPTSPVAQPLKQASSRITPFIKKARAPLAPPAKKTAAPRGPQAGKASAPLNPPANKATAPLASHVANVTALQNRPAAARIVTDPAPLTHGPSSPPPMPPPPMPDTQGPASLSRSSSSSSSCSSQSSATAGLLEELRNHRGVQDLKKRTSEHNSEGESSAETPPEQIKARPVNGRRIDQPVYVQLSGVLKGMGGPSGTVHEGLDKAPVGSQESPNDSGVDSPPPSPTQPESPVESNPAAPVHNDRTHSRFGVWHTPAQLNVLAEINNKFESLDNATSV
jgi:hypothetical protein